MRVVVDVDEVVVFNMLLEATFYTLEVCKRMPDLILIHANLLTHSDTSHCIFSVVYSGNGENDIFSNSISKI